jgi:hypothetical protein
MHIVRLAVVECHLRAALHYWQEDNDGAPVKSAARKPDVECN